MKLKCQTELLDTTVSSSYSRDWGASVGRGGVAGGSRGAWGAGLAAGGGTPPGDEGVPGGEEGEPTSHPAITHLLKGLHSQLTVVPT